MHFNLDEFLLHARCRSHPPAPSFDRELQTHRVGSFGVEDVVVLEDALSEVPDVPDCRFIVTTFHCMYIQTTQAMKRSKRPPLGLVEPILYTDSRAIGTVLQNCNP